MICAVVYLLRCPVGLSTDLSRNLSGDLIVICLLRRPGDLSSALSGNLSGDLCCGVSVEMSE